MTNSIKFYDLESELGVELNSKEAYEKALKAGYKFFFRWINSDNGWCFFTKTKAQSIKGAVELYITEKKEKNKKTAEQYYTEYVDVCSVREFIDDQFQNEIKTMENQETFTIVYSSGKHYDTNEEKFLESSWERTFDSKAYLERIMENGQDKFEGCKIENNVEK